MLLRTTFSPLWKDLRHVLSRTTIAPSWKNFRYLSGTVDRQEIENFQRFTTDWWDEFGPFKALHSMNRIRVPFVRDGLMNSGRIRPGDCPFPLEGVSILDVGCGGGILCEPLAKLGAHVTGLDADPCIIESAKSHALSSKLSISYVESTIEKHAVDNPEGYDAIVASEVLEHVTRKDEFIEACTKCLKPSGSIFFTTINKTTKANVLGIFAAETVLKLVPEGTHQYEKFIEPHRLQKMLEDNNCRTYLIHGMYYNFLTNNWHWCCDDSICYALHAVKMQPDSV